jgi:hypothetical protein
MCTYMSKWLRINAFYCTKTTKRTVVFPRCGLKFSQHRKKSRWTEYFLLGEGLGEKYRVAEGGVRTTKPNPPKFTYQHPDSLIVFGCRI